MSGGHRLSLCAALIASACANACAPAIDYDSDDAVAALLLRCKVGELEEDLQRDGLPEAGAEGKDRCCAGAESRTGAMSGKAAAAPATLAPIVSS